jgi:aminocarboxymuconate-semialdehyde decarboxylase
MGKFIEEMNLDLETKEDIFYKAALDWLQVPLERFKGQL